MQTFGARLKKERTRLGLTQTELAEIGEVQKNAQSLYERDANSPDVSYLEKIAGKGVDIHFLFYGVYSETAASRQFGDLLAVLYRLSPEQQAIGFGMLSMLQANAVAAESGATAPDLTRADALWRGARLYNVFLTLAEEEKQMVEKAAEVMQIKPPLG
jgi:transcriptional regulator with XRE-family HTH domain